METSDKANFSISSFPDEILDEIFRHLNQVTVLETILVNKKFHCVGLRKLYRNIYLHDTEEYPPLELTSETDSPFYREFTIINEFEQLDALYLSKYINLVRYMLCPFHQLDSKEEINERFPWINVELQSDYYDEYDALKLGFFKEIHLDGWVPMSRDNNCVTNLSIEVTNTSTNVLDLVPQMKRLEMLEIVGFVKDVFNYLELDHKNYPLKIKSLSLVLWEDNFVDYTLLMKLFDLDEIISFEIKLVYEAKEEVDPDPLTLLMPLLPKLKVLCFESPNVLPFSKIISSLPKDSLKKLFIACSDHPPLTTSLLKEYISHHSNSLTEFLFSPITRRLPASREFERVYKIKRNEGDNIQTEEIKLIENFLQQGLLYPKLRHIICNRNHYSITSGSYVKQIN